MELAIGITGEPVTVQIETRSSTIKAKVWRMKVGRCDLLLLDSTVDSNTPEDRQLTSDLYGGDARTRIRHEMLLGVGGFRALQAMEIIPGVLHMNEGHNGFAVLEAIRTRMEDEGLSFDQAVPRVSRQVVFTTHTPVAAGHDCFNSDLIEEYLGPLREQLGLSHDRLMGARTGKSRQFSRTVLHDHIGAQTLASRQCSLGAPRRDITQYVVGPLSRQAGRRRADRPYHQRRPCAHLAGAANVRLYDRHFGNGRYEHVADATTWEGIENVDNGELWETHLSLKTRMLRICSAPRRRTSRHREEPPENLRRVGRVSQPGRADDRLCAPLRDVQARQFAPPRHRNAGRHGQ